MTETTYALLSVAIYVIAIFAQPSHATCPAGHYVNGVRPSGDFACVPAPIGDPDYDGVYGWPERSTQPPGELHSRIYCTGGMHPVVRDHRTVGCQR